MIHGKSVLVYIPARSGSKGIKNKNIIEVAGKSLIAYTIEAAKKSKYVDRVIVSTDSEIYASISRQYGAEVPFLRPAELATDTSPEMDTTMHLMNWIEEHASDYSGGFDIIIRLQVTSPLRKTEDIDGALEQFMASGAEGVVSVFECPVTPLWMNTLPADLCMNNFISPEIRGKNRQDLPIYYQLNGAIFMSDWRALKNTKSWYGPKTYAFVMSREHSVDVDNKIDLEFVTFLFEKKSRT